MHPLLAPHIHAHGCVSFSVCAGTSTGAVILKDVYVCVCVRVCAGTSIGVVVFKGIMWLICRNSNNPSVQAFALDHLNDVAVNSAGLVGGCLGTHTQTHTHAHTQAHASPGYTPALAKGPPFLITRSIPRRARTHASPDSHTRAQTPTREPRRPRLYLSPKVSCWSLRTLMYVCLGMCV